MALARSAIREVVVLGRRGPAEAAFTVPELVGLRGLVEQGRVNVIVEADDLDGSDQRSRLLAEIAVLPRHPSARTIVLRFLGAPVALVGKERVTGLEIARTRLEVDAAGRRVAVATPEREVIATGLVLRAVGYRGLPVTDLPYDAATGTVPHDRGRVRPGVYVAGWVKRGPTGFIGSNKGCAQESVARLLDDLDAGLGGSTPLPEVSIEDLVAERVPGALDLVGWRALDAEERRRGLQRGRPRVKVVDVEEMSRIARAAQESASGPGAPDADGASPRRRGYPSVSKLLRRAR